MEVGQSPSCVAVVDDDPSLREAIDSLLRSVGFSVESFCSAEEFLASSARQHALCVVLDVGLPGMDGLQLQAALNRGCRPLPVVFVSAVQDRGGHLLARASRGGALAFLRKPVVAEDLLSAVRAACTPPR